MTLRFFSAAGLANTALLALFLLLTLVLGRGHSDFLWPSPSQARVYAALLALLLWLSLCLYIGLRQHGRRRREAVQKAALRGQGLGQAKDQPWLVSWASQTGFAEQLARQTAEALQAAGQPVCLLALAQLDVAMLAVTKNALFVVSTTGEGDAPDAVAGFMQRLHSASADLSGLNYGLLALGDSSYVRFCAFGRHLDHVLQQAGAQAHFDRVEVDNGDAAALRHWQHQLGVLSGHREMADWSAPEYQPWRLQARVHLNPGSVGAPVFHLRLVAPPEATALHWQAGDIVEIGPRNALADIEALLLLLGRDGHERMLDDGHARSLHEVLATRVLPHEVAAQRALWQGGLQAVLDLKPLAHREYSIASLPDDGGLELMLRQQRLPDGRLGVGSGWLTEHAPIGGDIALRIRRNSSFHAPADERPLILIGNGTGIAGLRAHIRQRELRGLYRNWLVFGERHAEHDFYFREQILAWQQQGVLARLDLAFSRDQDERVYVQHRLQAAADVLRLWVSEGAAIYVCGSLRSMAPAVHSVLQEALGATTLEQLSEAGLYRRDVY